MKYISLLLVLFSMNAFARTNLTCVGTEPFFKAQITARSVDFLLLGVGSVSEEITSKTNARGTNEFAYKVKTPSMSASVITGDCNDGMSDRIYSHHLLLEVGSEVYYGCCSKF